MDGCGPDTSVQETSEDGSSAIFPAENSSKIQSPTQLDHHELEMTDPGLEIQTQDSETMQSRNTCSITGQDHLSLQHFGITKCPKCQIDLLDEGTAEDSYPHISLQSQDTDIASQLSQILFDVKEVKLVTDRIKLEDLGTSTESSHEEDVQDKKWHEDENSNMILGEEENLISQRVDIFNYEERVISSQAWKGNFDLDRARQDVDKRSGDSEAIALLTISLSTDSWRAEKTDAREVLQDLDLEITNVRKRLEITSRPFINALKQVVSYFPGPVYGTTRLSLEEPFALIAHHAGELLEFRSTFYELRKEDNDENPSTKTSDFNVPTRQRCSEVAHNHIGILLDYLGFNGKPGPIQDELDRHQRDSPVCTFAMLWLLYKPGITVYNRSEDHAEAFIVENVSGNQSYDESSCFLKLWQLQYDGDWVRRGNKTVIISAFEGERPIADLKVIPAAFADKLDGGKLRGELVASGKKWYALLRGGKQQHYKGPTRQKPSENLDTRVVVDVRSYHSTSSYSAMDDVSRPPPPPMYNGMRGGQNRRQTGYPPPPRPIQPNFRPKESVVEVEDYGADLHECGCEKCQGVRPHPPLDFPWTDYDVLDPQTQESLELPSTYADRDHRYLLCERSIWGFVLSTRTWAKLDPAFCREPTINTAAINSLVMPDERKRMIKAIVQKYVDPEFTPGKPHEHWGADFIKNKGEGQIFLLHGGPGVGKTFCISENIGRPLLALTCADFGTDEVQMEKNLLKWFKLAESWGAVMLLDEADVWLERRLTSDLKRNTMVAVFLRCIEYYRGILFLTSNRVGTFDDAFISRIHVVIKYDNLGERERSKIWEQFFQKLENERKDIFVDSSAKDYVLEDSKMRTTQWNGREIRNAFQTAVSLAEYRFHHEGGKETRRKVVLDKIDFEQVCKMSVDFKSYLSSLHGDSEEDRAMRQGDRYNG